MTVAGSTALPVQTRRTNLDLKPGFFIARARGAEFRSARDPQRLIRGKRDKWVPLSEKSCHPGGSVSRIAAPRDVIAVRHKEDPMNKKNARNKIGGSLLFTLALIVLTYLLLPNGDSVGASPRTPQAASTTQTLAASVRADQKRARMALGQLPLSFEMNRGQFPAEVQFASRGASFKTFFTQSEMVFVLRKPSAAANSNTAATSKPTDSRDPAQLQRDRQQRAAERAASKAVVRMSLVGANLTPAVNGVDVLPGKIN